MDLIRDKAELRDIKGLRLLVEYEVVISSRDKHALKTFSIGFLETFKQPFELRLVVLHAAAVRVIEEGCVIVWVVDVSVVVEIVPAVLLEHLDLLWSEHVSVA